MSPLHILITAEILYNIIMLMSSQDVHHSKVNSSCIQIQVLESPLSSQSSKYIDVYNDDSSVEYRTKSHIAWLHIKESFINANFYVSFRFMRIAELSIPLPLNMSVGSNMTIPVKHSSDKTTCRNNSELVFCFSHFGVSPGSYMRMTFSDLQNPGYYTQNCEYSGFAVVEPDRMRYIGEVGKLHMDHSLPVVTLCHSGYKKDGTPFPHTYTTFYSSIIIVYFAFLHNPTEAAKVQNTFSMNIHIERTLCAGYFLKCQIPVRFGCTRIPPGTPLHSQASSQLSCDKRTKKYFSTFYKLATRNYSHIAYIATSSVLETISIHIYTDHTCFDVQYIPSYKVGEICSMMIQPTTGRYQSSDIYKVNRYTTTKDADTCRKEDIRLPEETNHETFHGIDTCMHLSVTFSFTMPVTIQQRR